MAGVGEGDGVGDDCVDLRLEAVEVGLRDARDEVVVGQQPGPEGGDGVTLLPLGHLFLGAVELLVALGVAEVAVGDQLEQDGALAGAGVLDGAGGGAVDGEQVHAVDAFAGDAVGDGAVGDGGGAVALLDRHRHAVLVVFADKDDGQLPDGGHVEAFVEIALVGGAVAKEAHDDAAVGEEMVGEAGADGERNAAGDDAVGAEAAEGEVGHVHGAAAAAADAGLLGEQLGHHQADILALGDGVAVAAVGGDDIVVRVEGGDGADGDGFLADGQVHGAVDLAERELVKGGLLEGTNQEHLPEQVEEAGAVEHKRRFVLGGEGES